MSNKKLKLCPGPRCRQKIEQWRFCCKWHWTKLPDDLRGAILAGNPAKKYEGVKFLQEQQREIDQKRREENEQAGRADH